MLLRIGIALQLIVLLAAGVNAGTAPKFNYNAQKKLIPAELGRVYIGMPLKELAARYDLSKAEVGDIRFEELPLTITVNGKQIVDFTVKVGGLTQAEKEAMVIRGTETTENGFERETLRFDPTGITSAGFVYQFGILFRKDFDLKSFVIKTYGKNGEVRRPDDEYRIYDIQWEKKTSDGLNWLIRSFHEGDDRSLQLIGRIDGTEWGLG